MSEDRIWIIVFNVLGWPLIQIGESYLFLSLPSRWFERGGKKRVTTQCRLLKFYKTVLGLHRWKKWVPDGADWFFPELSKGAVLRKRPRQEGRSFLRAESCRGMIAHFSMFVTGALIFTYNPLWPYIVMLFAGLILNFPCFLVLHYNYLRTDALSQEL